MKEFSALDTADICMRISGQYASASTIFCMPLICPSTVLRRVSSFFRSAGVRSVRSRLPLFPYRPSALSPSLPFHFPLCFFVLSLILTAESKIFFLIRLYPPGVYLSIKKLYPWNTYESIFPLPYGKKLEERSLHTNKIPNRKSKVAGSFCHPAVLYKAKFFCKPRFPCFFSEIYTSANAVPISIHYSRNKQMLCLPGFFHINGFCFSHCLYILPPPVS